MEILSCENVAFKYNESTDYAISDCTFSVKKAKNNALRCFGKRKIYSAQASEKRAFPKGRAFWKHHPYGQGQKRAF